MPLPKVMLLAKTAESLKPDPTEEVVEPLTAGKSQASSRRLCAKELEHIPKEMIAKKTENNRRLPTIKHTISKVSDFASG
jgi:hypothetical protein